MKYKIGTVMREIRSEATSLTIRELAAKPSSPLTPVMPKPAEIKRLIFKNHLFAGEKHRL